MKISTMDFVKFLSDNLGNITRYNRLIDPKLKSNITQYLDLFDIKPEKDSFEMRVSPINKSKTIFIQGISMPEEKDLLSYINSGNYRFLLQYSTDGNNLPNNVVLEDHFKLYLESFGSISFDELFNSKEKYECKDQIISSMFILTNNIFDAVDNLANNLLRNTWFYSSFDEFDFTNLVMDNKNLKDLKYTADDLIVIATIIYGMNLSENEVKDNIFKFIKLRRYFIADGNDDVLYFTHIDDINDDIIEEISDIVFDIIMDAVVFGNKSYFEEWISINQKLKTIINKYKE